MKQSTKVSKRQFALWLERGDQVQPSEEIREEVTRALAELLLEALRGRVPTKQCGGGDESEDHV